MKFVVLTVILQLYIYKRIIAGSVLPVVKIHFLLSHLLPIYGVANNEPSNMSNNMHNTDSHAILESPFCLDIYLLIKICIYGMVNYYDYSNVEI